MVSRIKPQDQRRRAVRLDLSLQHIAAVALVKGIARKRLVLFIRLDRVAGRAITDLGRIRNLLAGLGVVAEQRVRRLIARYPLRIQRRVFLERDRIALFITKTASVRLCVPSCEGVTARRDRIAPFYRDFRILFVLSAGRALPRIIGNIRQIVQIDLSFVTVRAAADRTIHMPASVTLDDIPLDILRFRIPKIFSGSLIILLVPAIDHIPSCRRDFLIGCLGIRLSINLGNVLRQVGHISVFCIVRTRRIGNRRILRRGITCRLCLNRAVVADEESDVAADTRIRRPCRIERIGLRIIGDRKHIGQRCRIAVVPAINLIIEAITASRSHGILVCRPALEVASGF